MWEMRPSLKKSWSRSGLLSQPGLGRNDVRIELVFREGHVGDAREADEGGDRAVSAGVGWLWEELGYLVSERAFG